LGHAGVAERVAPQSLHPPRQTRVAGVLPAHPHGLACVLRVLGPVLAVGRVRHRLGELHEAHARVERQRTCYDLPVPVPEDERRAELQRLVHVLHARVAARRVGPDAARRLVPRQHLLRADGLDDDRAHQLSARMSMPLSCGSPSVYSRSPSGSTSSGRSDVMAWNVTLCNALPPSSCRNTGPAVVKEPRQNHMLRPSSAVCSLFSGLPPTVHVPSNDNGWYVSVFGSYSNSSGKITSVRSVTGRRRWYPPEALPVGETMLRRFGSA